MRVGFGIWEAREWSVLSEFDAFFVEALFLGDCELLSNRCAKFIALDMDIAATETETKI